MKNKIKVLLVEDEAFTAMSLQLELNRAGYDVYKITATGEEAIVIVEQEPPDIILMDIRLAGRIDGVEAARKIKTFNDIPVIFMTGYTDEKIMEQAMELNPAAYFIKPIRVYELRNAIDSHIT